MKHLADDEKTISVICLFLDSSLIVNLLSRERYEVRFLQSTLPFTWEIFVKITSLFVAVLLNMHISAPVY